MPAGARSIEQAPSAPARHSRRDLLARGAVAGGILWATPAIESIASKAAAASFTGLPSVIYYAKTYMGATYYFKITVDQSTGTFTCAGLTKTTGSELPNPAPTCSDASYTAVPSNYTACQDVAIAVTSSGVEVCSTISGEAPQASISFMLCGSTYYKPTSKTIGTISGTGSPSTNGDTCAGSAALVFNCNSNSNGGTC